MVTTDYSGHTPDRWNPLVLWEANAPGDFFFIQNLNPASELVVLLALPARQDGSVPDPIQVVLPDRGDFIDSTHLDPSLSIAVRGELVHNYFTAYRSTPDEDDV